MNQLLHLLVHSAGHVLHHYRHQQHRGKAEARQRAHGLSRFAGLICDTCEQAGLSVSDMQPECVAYSFRGRGICIADGGESIVCLAATPYRFYAGVPQELEEFLERRNSSLKYGCWGLPNFDGEHNTLMFRVTIAPNVFDLDLFMTVTEYASCERDEVEAMLERAGYSRS